MKKLLIYTLCVCVYVCIYAIGRFKNALEQMWLSPFYRWGDWGSVVHGFHRGTQLWSREQTSLPQSVGSSSWEALKSIPIHLMSSRELCLWRMDLRLQRCHGGFLSSKSRLCAVTASVSGRPNVQYRTYPLLSNRQFTDLKHIFCIQLKNFKLSLIFQ